MRNVQDQLDQEIRDRVRFRRASFERPSAWPIILRWSSLLLLAVLIVLGITAFQVASLGWRRPGETAMMRYRLHEAEIAGVSYQIHQTWKPLKEIPKPLQDAVVAAEDDGFYQHGPFDLRAMVHAFKQNHQTGVIQRGGSTITQQLAKNLFLSPERTYTRKLREAVIASMISTFLTRDRILELYLNVVETGPGMYGVEEGAKYHYGLHVGQLTFQQGCRLASILPSPLRYRIYGDYVTAQATALAARLGRPDAFDNKNDNVALQLDRKASPPPKERDAAKPDPEEAIPETDTLITTDAAYLQQVVGQMVPAPGNRAL